MENEKTEHSQNYWLNLPDEKLSSANGIAPSVGETFLSASKE